MDGNGRIGRVLNNYLLIRDGHVPMNIKFIDRSLYYDAFVAFDEKGETSIMKGIVGKALSSSYQKRLAYWKDFARPLLLLKNPTTSPVLLLTPINLNPCKNIIPFNFSLPFLTH